MSTLPTDHPPPAGVAALRRSTTGPTERWFVALACYLSVVGWLSVLLAELGVLGMGVFLPLCVVAAVVVMIALLRLTPSPADLAPGGADASHRASPAAILSTLVVPGAVLVLCGALFFPPYATFLWGSDSTVYLNLGQEISRNRSYRFEDPLITEVPATARPEVFRNQTVLDATGDLVRLPGGLRIEDLEQPAVFAGFSPVFPALNAVVFSLLGVDAMPYLAPVFGTLSIVALCLLGRAVASTFAGFGAAVLALLTMPQAWFARFPMPEVVAEFFVVSGLLALSVALAARSNLGAAVAGWLMGIAALTKFELIPILTVGLLIWVGVDLLCSGRGLSATKAWFAGAYSIPLVHAAIHYSVWPTHYRFFVEDLLGAIPFADRLSVSTAGGGLAIAALIAIVAGIALRGSSRARALAAAPRVWGSTIGVLVAVYFLGYFVVVDNQLARTSSWLGWYLSWPALLALAAGATGFFCRRRHACSAAPPAREDGRGDVIVLSLVLLAVAGIHIVYNPQSSGEQIWSARRFVPMIVPLTALLLGTLVLEPLRTLRPRIGPAIAVLVLVALGSLVGRPTLSIARKPLWDQARATSDAVAAMLPDDARVIVSAELSGTHLATTLNYTHEIPTLVLQPIQRTPTVLGAMIENWLDMGHPVFLIVGDRPFSFYAPGLEGVQVGRMLIDITVLERTRDRRPESIVRDRAPIVIMRVLRRAQVPVAVDVGDPADDSFFQITGFYAAERNERSRDPTFRWTAARATMLIPVVSGLKLTLSGGRPTGAMPARVSIYVDKVRIAEDVAIPNRLQELTFDRLPDPELPGGDAPPARQLAIATTVFVPKETAASPDSRRLGVQLYRLEFIDSPARPSGPTSAAQ